MALGDGGHGQGGTGTHDLGRRHLVGAVVHAARSVSTLPTRPSSVLLMMVTRQSIRAKSRLYWPNGYDEPPVKATATLAAIRSLAVGPDASRAQPHGAWVIVMLAGEPRQRDAAGAPPLNPDLLSVG